MNKKISGSGWRIFFKYYENCIMETGEQVLCEKPISYEHYSLFIFIYVNI